MAQQRIPTILKRIGAAIKTLFSGSQRSLSTYRNRSNTMRGRNFDIEIAEHPVRDPKYARMLIEMVEYCPEVGAAIDHLRRDCFSSADGDDQGFVIKEEYAPGQRLDGNVLAIANDLKERIFSAEACDGIVERMLAYGDCFAELSFDRSLRGINGLMILPTWEMFRIEHQSAVEAFHQRQRLWQETPDVEFIPAKIIHWRYRRKNLYGRALFAESPEDWGRLRSATEALATAALTVGINPNLHVLPEDTTTEEFEEYRDRHEARQLDGIVTDFYMANGGDIRKLANNDPDLSALIAVVLQWRTRIVMKSGVPPYLLGLQQEGAKDIAGQPALSYARHVNDVRGSFTTGVIQAIHTELMLKEIPEELWRGKIKLEFPKISVNTFQQQSEDDAAQEDSAIAPSKNGVAFLN